MQPDFSVPAPATSAAPYNEALESALAVRHPGLGLLRVAGADRLDFLNRMSTNQLIDMPADRIRPTVFTSPLGRIVACAQVLTEPDQLYLLTEGGRAAALAEWLRGYIFFQDEVALEPVTDEHPVWGLYGPQADRRAAEMGFELRDLAPGECASRPAGAKAWALDRPLPGFQLLLDAKADAAALERWSQGEAVAAAYEILRVESGLPAWGHEISEQVIPLEVDLWQAVSFSKGCYIGQEIIARMESRGRRARQLAGVLLDGPAQPGFALRQGGSAVGKLSSVAQSPRLGWIGLALVKPSALEVDSGAVRVDEGGPAARLVELPFDFDPAG